MYTRVVFLLRSILLKTQVTRSQAHQGIETCAQICESGIRELVVPESRLMINNVVAMILPAEIKC